MMQRFILHMNNTLFFPGLDPNVTYFARLWCKDTGKETDVVQSERGSLGAKDVVVIRFKAAVIDGCFEPGDILNLSVWNEQHTQAFTKHKKYKVTDEHIECNPEAEGKEDNNE